ncbi:tyrosine-protein phosphatase Lar isoform X1 [Rhipicephalus microplus]|uniref:tyrosine-protein phosphatase Lar isoform X1 n=2 Tax=Rhipicephalus microplus TaxID=6941 RepID=UPI003F6B02EA
MLRHLLQALVLLQLASAVLATKDAEPPRIVISPRDQTVVTGGTAAFTCMADGNPQPQIEWRKSGKRLFSWRYTVTEMTGGSVLRIDPVRSGKEDATYECLAENGVGDPARAQFKLTVLDEYTIPQGFPRFEVVPKPQGVELNRSVVLPCEAQGEPEPTISWLRNVIPINMTNPRYSLAASGSLEISDAQEEDQGNYECIAENSVGTAISTTATLFVRVRRVPPYFASPPERTYEVYPGAALNLTCVAVGAPMPFVQWLRGRVDLAAYGEPTLGRNDLMLEDIRESANYSCVASSPLGSIERVSQVLVREGENQSLTYSRVGDTWADFDNRTDENATSTVRSGSAASSADTRTSLARPASVADLMTAEGETTLTEAAGLAGTLSSPQKSVAEEARVRIALLQEEHALRMRLIQEDHDDVLKKRDAEHKLKMEVLRLQKEVQDFVLKRLQQGE